MADTRSMLKAIALLLLTVTFFAGALLHAEEVDNEAYWLCKNKGEVRTIRVHINTEGICTTFYSKSGSEKPVGSGRNQDACMNFLNNIKTNLEKSSWNCRDITDTKITASL